MNVEQTILTDEGRSAATLLTEEYLELGRRAIGAADRTITEVAFSDLSALDRLNDRFAQLSEADQMYVAQRVMEQPDLQNLITRVFGENGLRPQEPLLMQQTGESGVFRVDQAEDPTTFTSNEYVRKRNMAGRLVTFTEQLDAPENTMFATFSADGGQPAYRYDNEEGLETRQDKEIVTLVGGIDLGVRESEEVYGPPPSMGDEDVLNHIQVRIPLAGRYKGDVWGQMGGGQPRVHTNEELTRRAFGYGDVEVRMRKHDVGAPVSGMLPGGRTRTELTEINAPDSVLPPSDTTKQMEITSVYETIAGSFV